MPRNTKIPSFTMEIFIANIERPILKARMELISIGACVPLLYWTVNQGVDDIGTDVLRTAEEEINERLGHGN